MNIGKTNSCKIYFGNRFFFCTYIASCLYHFSNANYNGYLDIKLYYLVIMIENNQYLIKLLIRCYLF